MLDDVNKLFVIKSLFTTPSNVLLLHLKQTFPPIIWIFTEGEGDGFISRLPFKMFSTLQNLLWRTFFSLRKWNLPNPIDIIWAISEIFENINALFCQELTKYQSKLLIAHHVAINYLSCSVELPKLACAFHWKFFSSPNGAATLLKSHVSQWFLSVLSNPH